MGTDIHGWVEFRDAKRDALLEEVHWCAVIDASWLLEREYNAFGSLFGVRNDSAFVPIAAGRGLPENVSEIVLKSSSWEGFHSHT